MLCNSGIASVVQNILCKETCLQTYPLDEAMYLANTKTLVLVFPGTVLNVNSVLHLTEFIELIDLTIVCLPPGH